MQSILLKFTFPILSNFFFDPFQFMKEISNQDAGGHFQMSPYLIFITDVECQCSTPRKLIDLDIDHQWLVTKTESYVNHVLFTS